MARITLVPQRKEFFELYNQAAANAVAITRLLVDLLGRKPDGETADLIRDIKELEHEGDRLNHEVISELFRSGDDALDVIRWKDVHEQLEEAVDACENAADVLEAILVKNR